jgi:hypothetical protein
VDAVGGEQTIGLTVAERLINLHATSERKVDLRCPGN